MCIKFVLFNLFLGFLISAIKNFLLICCGFIAVFSDKSLFHEFISVQKK